MAIPPNAKAIAQPADPYDVDVYGAEVTRGPATPAVPFPTLKEGENIAGFTLELTAEAIAAGLEILDTAPYPRPAMSGLTCVFWLGVAAEMQSAPMFNGSGVTLAIELNIETDAVPPRKRQKTFTVTVANQ